MSFSGKWWWDVVVIGHNVFKSEAILSLNLKSGLCFGGPVYEFAFRFVSKPCYRLGLKSHQSHSCSARMANTTGFSPKGRFR